MSVIAAAVEALIAAGVTGDDLVQAVAKMEAAQASTRSQPREFYARRLGVPAVTWGELRTAVFERDQFCCRYCGRDASNAPQCDHVIPLARGGTSTADNLVTACKSCNSSKRDSLLHEWIR